MKIECFLDISSNLGILSCSQFSSYLQFWKKERVASCNQRNRRFWRFYQISTFYLFFQVQVGLEMNRWHRTIKEIMVQVVLGRSRHFTLLCYFSTEKAFQIDFSVIMTFGSDCSPRTKTNGRLRNMKKRSFLIIFGIFRILRNQRLAKKTRSKLVVALGLC